MELLLLPGAVVFPAPAAPSQGSVCCNSCVVNPCSARWERGSARPRKPPRAARQPSRRSRVLSTAQVWGKN